MRIVLITSGQPSANPRLVKEARALNDAGHAVTVIYCRLSPWADAFDATLFMETPRIRWVFVGYHSLKQPWGYKLVRLRKKIYEWLWKFFFKTDPRIAIRSMVFYSQELTKEALQHEAELYIGHNLGALPAVIAAKKKFKAKAGFDFEDFHRGEDKEGSVHWQKTALVESYYCPYLNYATTASPLITAAYERIFPGLSVTTIQNCFPFSYHSGVKSLAFAPLKLFWFSQFVGKNRGLETVIEAMGLVNNKQVVLGLLGNCTVAQRSYLEMAAQQAGLQNDQLLFLGPAGEKDIVTIASGYHIGLACEEAPVLNRELCLTNKIYLYLLAGNAVLFTNTRAQVSFLHAYPDTGNVYPKRNAQQLANLIAYYAGSPAVLTQQRMAASRLSEVMNWDVEKMKLLGLVNQIEAA